jgi:Flp pilus assembly protein TadG
VPDFGEIRNDENGVKFMITATRSTRSWKAPLRFLTRRALAETIGNVVRRTAIVRFTTGVAGVFGPNNRMFSNSLSFGLSNLCNDQRGTIAVITGLSATALVGFAALAVDVASWQVAQRSMQGAADAAAYSAGVAYNLNNGNSIVTQAKGITAQIGYVDGQNGATVTVNQPPKSGGYTSNATAIEVIVQQPQARYLSGLFLSSNPTVSARAVADILSGPACILALSPTANQAINVSGSANVDSPGCSLIANSDAANAINLSGSGKITAPCLDAVGNVSVTSGLDLTKCTSPTTGVAAATDPYASVPQPTASGSCLTVPNTATVALSYGYYCHGLHISGSQSATFGAGVYYVTGGNFQIDGAANGTGVTFFITAGNQASVTGGPVTFTAPTSGTYSGITFFGDRAGTTSTNNNFSGGSNMSITGAIYFPTQSVTFSGGSGTTCTQVIGDVVTVSGNADFAGGSACNGDGMSQINIHNAVAGTVQLVE